MNGLKPSLLKHVARLFIPKSMDRNFSLFKFSFEFISFLCTTSITKQVACGIIRTCRMFVTLVFILLYILLGKYT